MRVRVRQLATSLVRAVGVAGPGRVIVIVGKDGKVANVVKEEQLSLAFLESLPPASVPEEPPQ